MLVVLIFIKIKCCVRAVSSSWKYGIIHSKFLEISSLTQLIKKFLSMRSSLSTCPCFNMFMNFVPIFTIKSQSFQKSLVFVLIPPSIFYLRLPGFRYCTLIFISLVRTFRTAESHISGSFPINYIGLSSTHRFISIILVKIVLSQGLISVMMIVNGPALSISSGELGSISESF